MRDRIQEELNSPDPKRAAWMQTWVNPERYRQALVSPSSPQALQADRPTRVQVELAYTWKCPCCMAQNYERAVTKEFSEQEAAEIAADEGFTPQTGEWVTRPDELECLSCGRSFQGYNAGQTDE